ncbi:MAG: hypothetical protein ACYCY8_12355 [Burkholderiales bacterium]
MGNKNLREHRVIVTLLSVIFTGCSIFVQDTYGDTDLYCSGMQSGETPNGPKYISMGVQNFSGIASQIYEISGTRLKEKGYGYGPDVVLTQCHKSSSEYVYSTNCKINQMQYLSDWQAETNHVVNLANPDRPSPFFQKYGDVGGNYEILIINRLDLSLTDHYYEPQTWYKGNKANGYMVIYRYNAKCSIQKPKF